MRLVTSSCRYRCRPSFWQLLGVRPASRRGLPSAPLASSWSPHGPDAPAGACLPRAPLSSLLRSCSLATCEYCATQPTIARMTSLRHYVITFVAVVGASSTADGSDASRRARALVCADNVTSVATAITPPALTRL